MALLIELAARQGAAGIGRFARERKSRQWSAVWRARRSQGAHRR